MLDIGIFAPFGDDHERNLVSCRVIAAAALLEGPEK